MGTTAAGGVTWVELGRIGAAFGVKGWVHVDSDTDPPEGLLDYAPWTLHLQSGARVVRPVVESRLQGGKLVARLEGCDHRDAAATLTGAKIEIDRASLPPTGDRQHYRADLIGIQVRNVEGVQLGTVRHFVDAPSGALMVVKDARGREQWIPAVPTYLRRVDGVAGLILVDWPVESE